MLGSSAVDYKLDFFFFTQEVYIEIRIDFGC